MKLQRRAIGEDRILSKPGANREAICGKRSSGSPWIRDKYAAAERCYSSSQHMMVQQAVYGLRFWVMPEDMGVFGARKYPVSRKEIQGSSWPRLSDGCCHGWRSIAAHRANATCAVNYFAKYGPPGLGPCAIDQHRTTIANALAITRRGIVRRRHLHRHEPASDLL